MLGFLFKIIVVVVLVVGVAGYLMMRGGNLSLSNFKVDPNQVLSQLPVDKNVLANFRQTDPSKVGSYLSQTLDSLVTHPGRNAGPVVLGVQVTNDSLGTITDVLMSLPSDQLNQIKGVICQPQAPK